MWFNHVPQANADRYAKLVLPSHSQRGVVLSLLREYSSLQNFINVLSTTAKPLSEYGDWNSTVPVQFRRHRRH